MEAVCRGAASAGGLTVGLLPGDDRRAANPYVAVVVPTGLGEARNALVVRAAEAVVAIGGGHGTLAEIRWPCEPERRWWESTPETLAGGAHSLDAVERTGSAPEAAERALALARARRS